MCHFYTVWIKEMRNNALISGFVTFGQSQHSCLPQFPLNAKLKLPHAMLSYQAADHSYMFTVQIWAWYPSSNTA